MRHAKLLIKPAIGALLAVAVACSADDTSFLDARTGGAFGDAGEPDKAKPEAASSSGGTRTPFSATGVVVVHAASFPSFRLCFGNMLDQVPQPDRTIMPEANVVGVEVGSLIRLDPMKAPGTIYLVRQNKVQALPGTDETKCSELIGKDGAQGTLDLNNDYYVATSIDEPLGESGVDVLAISGCGPQPMLDSLDGYGVGGSGKGNSKGCGAGWDPVFGKLTATRIPLPFNPEARVASSVPVQIVNLAPSVPALKGAATITFGALADDAAAGGLDVPIGEIFKPGNVTNLDIEQDAASVFGTTGFTVSATTSEGTVRATQSLANIQQLSAPTELPTSYYQAASNYVLLLLGDPSHKAPVPEYNPRRALHLLAVPVLDPSKVDAGAPPAIDAGEPADGGVR